MENMKVCNHCLLAIESREGAQAVKEILIDEGDTESRCDWCGQSADDGAFDILYELIPEV